MFRPFVTNLCLVDTDKTHVQVICNTSLCYISKSFEHSLYLCKLKQKQQNKQWVIFRESVLVKTLSAVSLDKGDK